MTGWVRGIALAVVFAVLGAFATSLWLEVRRDAGGAMGPPSGIWQGRRIRVEVLNGAGVDQLARRATERLRELGFDVVYYGNADRFDHDTSTAIARLDDVEPARRVAEALGLRKVEHEPDRNLYLDVTVILGADWAAMADAGAREETHALAVWWARIQRAFRRLWPGGAS